jgi:hypothetical protein
VLEVVRTKRSESGGVNGRPPNVDPPLPRTEWATACGGEDVTIPTEANDVDSKLRGDRGWERHRPPTGIGLRRTLVHSAAHLDDIVRHPKSPRSQIEVTSASADRLTDTKRGPRHHEHQRARAWIDHRGKPLQFLRHEEPGLESLTARKAGAL